MSTQEPIPHGESPDLDQRMLNAASQLITAARAHRMRIACAESLTGGWLAGALVSIPGASEVFVGSITAYHPRIKAQVLGVDEQLLARAGTVDPRVAKQMAQQVGQMMGAEISLATTGVAGPGSAEGKPAGWAYVAVAIKGAEPVVRHLYHPGERSEIRKHCVTQVLSLALAQLAAR